MAVNGHQLGLTSKQVLASVASAFTNRSCKGMSHTELLGLINAEPHCRQLYVLLHNIDGPGGLLQHPAPKESNLLHWSRTAVLWPGPTSTCCSMQPLSMLKSLLQAEEN
jgi:hypothetical protein